MEMADSSVAAQARPMTGRGKMKKTTCCRGHHRAVSLAGHSRGLTFLSMRNKSHHALMHGLWKVPESLVASALEEVQPGGTPLESWRKLPSVFAASPGSGMSCRRPIVMESIRNRSRVFTSMLRRCSCRTTFSRCAALAVVSLIVFVFFQVAG